MASVILGKDVETGEVVRIGDIERRSGLYLLGRTGMGKSALAINISLQDIDHGHGLFFLDPHGDAVNDLLRRGNAKKLKQKAHLFDIEDDDYSFGINLLTCDNVKSLRSRNAAYARAYNVFFKIWEEQWGVWLQLILENVLWAFIENPGYSLADVPMFLNPRNEDFRNHIISNIRYNTPVADFWRYEFFSRREQTQQERVDAALTRLNSLLNHPYVRDIVGQAKTTIDFANVLSTNKVILLKLSANLPEDVKKFVGTILLNELVHAVRDRPENKRTQFCIFIDEFHNFASSDYMATMVTEGRKFAVASTFLHVERFGQLVNNQKLMGATAAIVNKGLFQPTVADAEEFAPEFAKKVEATEKRREAELVISPHAVEDIWEKGHPDKQIMKIREEYFEVVDLLRSKPNESYYIFDPTKDRYLNGEDARFQWEAFDDWPAFRSTPEMIREGIGLLNKYYYQWVQDKPYTTKKQKPSVRNDQELACFLKIISCFAGVFGFRQTMQAYIPDDMRMLYAKRKNDIMDRKTEIASRLREDFRRERPRDQVPRFGGIIPPLTKLVDVPTHVSVLRIPHWRKAAFEAGFSIHELDQFIQWSIKPLNQYETKPFTEMVKLLFHRFTDERRFDREFPPLLQEYIAVKTREYTLSKFGEDPENLSREVFLPYMERVRWEVYRLYRFIFYCLWLCPVTLEENPVKIPGTKYDESLRVERTQQDLNNETTNELSNLPRFQAYVKLIDESEDRQIVRTHKIQTNSLPSIQDSGMIDQAIANGHTLGKKRDEIEAEIEERQKRWLPGSDNPTTRGR